MASLVAAVIQQRASSTLRACSRDKMLLVLASMQVCDLRLRSMLKAAWTRQSMTNGPRRADLGCTLSASCNRAKRLHVSHV